MLLDLREKVENVFELSSQPGHAKTWSGVVLDSVGNLQSFKICDNK